jgi:ABC-type molybdate transport system substrate-binding protein
MKDKGRYWEVPADAYPELDQAAVIVSSSSHKQQAEAFLKFLRSGKAQSMLKRYGFSLVGEKD